MSCWLAFSRVWSIQLGFLTESFYNLRQACKIVYLTCGREGLVNSRGILSKTKDITWKRTLNLSRITPNPWISLISPPHTSAVVWCIIPPLSRMKNNNPVFLSSRGDNFLFKNIKIFKIHQKFIELGRFEIWKSHPGCLPLDLYCNHYRSVQSAHCSYSRDPKGSSQNVTFKFQIDLTFWIFYGFWKIIYFWRGNYPLSSVEYRNYRFLLW